MALRTLGTNANNSLSALLFNPSAGVMSDSDLAALNALILPSSGTSGKLAAYLDRSGQLYIPGKSWIKVAPGDYVGVDSTGWPIVLSANAIANGPWTHNP